MKLYAGLGLGVGMALLVMLALGGCDMPAKAIEKAQKTTAGGLEERDVAVTARVNAALLGDANLKGFAIEIATLKGDVRLTGLLDSQSRIDHAIKLARAVEGVHSIHDELGLRKSGS